MKTCYRCKENKEPSEFSPDKRNSDGLQGTCNDCCNERRRERYKNEEFRKTQLQRQKRYNGYANMRVKEGIKKLSDTYIIASLKRGTSLNTMDIRKHPDLIELKRVMLRMKRSCRTYTNQIIYERDGGKL